MRFLKIFIGFILFLLILLIGFYFWAKKSIYPSDEYNSTTVFSKSSVPNLVDTFSLLTYNIGYLSGMTNNLPVERSPALFTNNLKKFTQLLQNLHPNIVSFQEIDFNSSRSFYVNQYQRIAKLSSFYNGAKAINWDKQYVPFPYWPIQYHFREMLSGQAVLTNFPILNSKRIVLPKPKNNPFYYNDFYLDRLAQLVWLQTKKDSILIINVHLEAWDAGTREIQAHIIMDLFNQYEREYPVMLVGDFNTIPLYDKQADTEKTLQIIMKQTNIASAISKAQYLANPEGYYTFDSRKPYQKIDYILYSPRHLSCIDARRVTEAGEISDHLPLFAHFVLKAEPKDSAMKVVNYR
jgi:endonuclease/exonuclease/phosphatase family metal-dependent hydrolase